MLVLLIDKEIRLGINILVFLVYNSIFIFDWIILFSLLRKDFDVVLLLVWCSLVV